MKPKLRVSLADRFSRTPGWGCICISIDTWLFEAIWAIWLSGWESRILVPNWSWEQGKVHLHSPSTAWLCQEPGPGLEAVLGCKAQQFRHRPETSRGDGDGSSSQRQLIEWNPTGRVDVTHVRNKNTLGLLWFLHWPSSIHFTEFFLLAKKKFTKIS